MHLKSDGKGVMGGLAKVIIRDEYGKAIIDEKYFQGMFVGIWNVYDCNADGFLDKFEMRDFFRDLFKQAQMDMTNISWEQLDQLFNSIDIT